MSNVCAILTTVLAGYVPNGWWIDPVGAIGISGYIVARWLAIAKQQVDKIVGRGAPVLFLQQLEDLANSHHAALGLDVIRAYHFGARCGTVLLQVTPPFVMSGVHLRVFLCVGLCRRIFTSRHASKRVASTHVFTSRFSCQCNLSLTQHNF